MHCIAQRKRRVRSESELTASSAFVGPATLLVGWIGRRVVDRSKALVCDQFRALILERYSIGFKLLHGILGCFASQLSTIALFVNHSSRGTLLNAGPILLPRVAWPRVKMERREMRGERVS